MPKPRRNPHVTTRRPTTGAMMATRKESRPSLGRRAARIATGAAMRALRLLGLNLDATVPDGLAERLPVALVLVREGLIERLRLPEIARDQAGCAGARVRAGERPPTGFRVLPHGPWREELGERLELHVAELAHVEVTTLGPDGPAQEEIAGRLHESLADDHPLAAIGIGGGAYVGLEHRAACSLHLQEERIVGARREERDRASGPHAPHSDHLGRDVLELVAIEEHPAILGQG